MTGNSLVQFTTLPPAAWDALLGLAALISAACIYVLLRRREGGEEMKRAWFYGARVRGLVAVVFTLLAVALVLALAILLPENLPAENLPAENLPAAPIEQAPSATPTSPLSSTPAPTITLSPTTTPLPPSTVTPTPSATPATTNVPARTLSPTATPTLYPLTPAPSPSVEPERSPTATSTLETERMLRRVVLSGELEALKRDDQISWPAVQLQCWNAREQDVGRVGLTQLDGIYRLPDETARVQLWIGSELGAADWWRNWDSRPADATSPEIILVVARVKHEAATLAPTPPPTLRPTATPCPP